MKRRDVLRLGGTSFGIIGGCVSPSTQLSPAETDPSPTESPRDVDNRTTTDTPPVETMEAGIPRTVTLTSSSDTDLRDAFGIEAEVTVLESSVTTAHTARLQIILENTMAQSQTLTYTRDTCDLNLIRGHYLRETSINLLLISTEQTWERTDDECWMPDFRNFECGIPSTEHEITIASDERLQWTFRLWAAPEKHDTGVCMPLRTYQFARTFSREDTEAPLAFTLSVDSG